MSAATGPEIDKVIGAPEVHHESEERFGRAEEVHVSDTNLGAPDTAVESEESAGRAEQDFETVSAGGAPTRYIDDATERLGMFAAMWGDFQQMRKAADQRGLPETDVAVLTCPCGMQFAVASRPTSGAIFCPGCGQQHTLPPPLASQTSQISTPQTATLPATNDLFCRH